MGTCLLWASSDLCASISGPAAEPQRDEAGIAMRVDYGSASTFSIVFARYAGLLPRAPRAAAFDLRMLGPAHAGGVHGRRSRIQAGQGDDSPGAFPMNNQNPTIRPNMAAVYASGTVRARRWHGRRRRAQLPSACRLDGDCRPDGSSPHHRPCLVACRMVDCRDERARVVKIVTRAEKSAPARRHRGRSRTSGRCPLAAPGATSNTKHHPTLLRFHIQQIMLRSSRPHRRQA